MSENDAPTVTTDELAGLDDRYLIDVRQPDEYDAGHVPGARLVPLDQLQARWRELPRDRTVYVICQAAGRSRAAATALRRSGVDAVVVEGGTARWVEEGRPVE